MSHVPRLCELKIYYTWSIVICVSYGAARLIYLLEWQGGRSSIPWRLVEEDCDTGKYTFVEKKRLPPGLNALRKPNLWNQHECVAWLKHLSEGDAGQLHEESIFQWFKTSPGTYHRIFCRGITAGAELSYDPESAAFALRVAQERASIPLVIRDDELPLVPLEPYRPILPHFRELIHTAAPNAVSTRLLCDLEMYESLGPYQVSSRFPIYNDLRANTVDTLQMTKQEWLARRELCSYLKYPAPMPDDTYAHIVLEDNMSFPEIFWDKDRANYLWTLPACLDYADPQRWIHGPSGTIVGGCNGSKWPLLLINVLKINLHRQGLIRDPRAPSGTSNEFTVEEIRQINDLETKWAKCFCESEAVLTNCLAEREQTPNAQLKSFQPVNDHDIKCTVDVVEPADSDNDWEVRLLYLSRIFSQNTVQESSAQSEDDNSTESNESESEAEMFTSSSKLKAPISRRRQRSSVGVGPVAKRVRTKASSHDSNLGETSSCFCDGGFIESVMHTQNQKTMTATLRCRHMGRITMRSKDSQEKQNAQSRRREEFHGDPRPLQRFSERESRYRRYVVDNPQPQPTHAEAYLAYAVVRS